ncbi:hypothetical protein RUM44_003729 [Polyplax serrata]|uniref:Uncharacterized protein n=1 Tax=Polyplax serrata TaxID=468196 RepID=A0ABR1AHB4_POLSC
MSDVIRAENFTAGKSSSQQSTGFIIGLMGLLMIFVVFIGAVYWWKRKYFSKCSLTAGQNKSETTRKNSGESNLNVSTGSQGSVNRKKEGSLASLRSEVGRWPSPLSLSKGLLGNYVPNPQYMADSAMPVPILPRDTLIFVQEIGEGCFGKVFKGKRNKMVEDLSCHWSLGHSELVPS